MSGPIDAASNPMHKQGLMTAKACLDIDHIDSLVQSSHGKVSLYGASNNAENYTILAGEVVYYDKSSGADTSSKIPVVSSVNMQGADAYAMYSTDPDAVRAFVENKIQVVGVAHSSVAARDKFSTTTGLSVAVAGVATVPVYSKKKKSIRPADRVRAVLPDASVSGYGRDQSHPSSKRRLEVESVDSASASKRAQLHLTLILDNPVKWREAMDNKLSSTNMWMSFARNELQSELVGTLLGLSSYIAYGIVQPTTAFLKLLKDVNGSGDRALANKASYTSLGPDDARQRAGDVVACYLGDYLSCLQVRNKSMELTGEQRESMQKLRLDLANRLFFNERIDAKGSRHINVAHEFGFYKGSGNNPSDTLGRTRQGGYCKRGDHYGEMLFEQVNRKRRVYGSYSDAVNVDTSNTLGKAITGAHANSRFIHVALGVNT